MHHYNDLYALLIVSVSSMLLQKEGIHNMTYSKNSSHSILSFRADASCNIALMLINLISSMRLSELFYFILYIFVNVFFLLFKIYYL